MFGSLIRAAAKLAVSAAATELRKPENQQKVGKAIAAATTTLRDPERREALGKTAGTVAGVARDTGARALGRLAGSIKNKLNQ